MTAFLIGVLLTFGIMCGLLTRVAMVTILDDTYGYGSWKSKAYPVLVALGGWLPLAVALVLSERSDRLPSKVS